MELKQLPRSSTEKPRLLSYVAYSKPYTLDYSRAGLLPTACLRELSFVLQSGQDSNQAKTSLFIEITHSDRSRLLANRDPE